ncbi:TRIC cation channel family protein [Alphaproteobacteria bacterium]|nr:TRIC cation channel family protein [Alphaproteobacteria bacterium]
MYETVSWKQHQDDLRSGKRHFAAGATKTKAREEFVYFSEPYRFEENALFTTRKLAETLSFKDIDQFLSEVKVKKLRLAVIDGFIYADPKVNDFIDNPQHAALIQKTADDTESLKLLEKGKVKGFLSDRIVGASIIRNHALGNTMTEVPLNIKTPIHLMFSKKSVPFSVVEEFNKTIKEFTKTSEYSNTVTWYLAPTLLLKTIDSPWFHFLELLGTLAFAMSGVFIAFERRSSLLAAFLFAFLPSFGGGVIRDVLFDVSPVHVLRTPAYFLTVVSVVLFSYLLSAIFKEKMAYFFGHFMPKKWRHSAENPYLVFFDALGLATFTISGIFVTLFAKATPLWLWGPFFGLLTSISGGILRDLLAKRDYIVALSGNLYGEWSLIWGGFFSYYIYANAMILSDELITRGIIITVIGIFCCRVGSFYLGLRSPCFK